MAIHLCSENSGTGNNISPRISFSHDFSQSDTIPVEQQFLRSFSSTADFNFCIQQNPHNHHASMADELFSDGKLIPAQIKQQQSSIKIIPPPPPPPLPPQSPTVNQNASKSFWGFKRSSSCGNGYARSLCPIPLMSRSNSTGSSTSTKRSSKEGYGNNSSTHKQHHHSFQKPPLRKTSYSYGNSNKTSNGVRVNPVLNLGFGSFFSNGKKK
ncbi:hypothetical protein QVD17_04907 [Tagetes erecta]|uniref:Uncharacterized protein n=1 Tax=Tagetes erecta TaxID=13708 RepID=A0AAD8LIN3_TARER|nr:hypothetical protein QVD17_04907 [Tagetes erecta]